MHSADISNLRAMFLLRLLSVNVEFLTELLHNEDRDSTIFMTQSVILHLGNFALANAAVDSIQYHVYSRWFLM